MQLNTEQRMEVLGAYRRRRRAGDSAIHAVSRVEADLLARLHKAVAGRMPAPEEAVLRAQWRYAAHLRDEWLHDWALHNAGHWPSRCEHVNAVVLDSQDGVDRAACPGCDGELSREGEGEPWRVISSDWTKRPSRRRRRAKRDDRTTAGADDGRGVAG